MKSVLADARIALIVKFLSISGMAIAGHQLGRIYPGVLVFFFIGLCSLLVLLRYGQHLFSIVCGAILLAISFRWFSIHIPETVIGADTPGNVRWTQRLIETGSAEAIGSAFYADAPIYYIFSAISAVVLDVEPASAIAVYAVILSVVPPLVVIAMIKSLGITKPQFLAIGALLAVATTEIVRRTYWPVAQSHASVHWWILLLIIIWYVRRPSKRLYALLAILLTTLALTHKIPLGIAIATFGTLLILHYIDRLAWKDLGDTSPLQQVLGLTVFTAVVMLVQWIYTSSLLFQIVNRFNRFYQELSSGGGGGAGGGSSFEPSAAITARPGLIAEVWRYPAEYALFVERGHLIAILLFSGLGWAILFLFARDRRYRHAVQILLAAAAVCVALMFVGLISINALNPTRPLLLIEPVLVCLIVGGLWLASNRWSRNFSVQSIAMTFLILLILWTQVFSGTVAADYANTPRYYLDSPEVKAADTLCEYSDEQIAVDQEYHQFGECSQFDRISRESTDPLYNANITEEEHPVVAYRHDPTVYLGYHDRWILTWDPSTELPQRYHTTYDNGYVTAYSKQTI